MQTLVLMNKMTFAQPGWIWIGLMVAIGMFLGILYFDRKKDVAMESFVTGKLLTKLRSSISVSKRWFKRGCLVVCIWLLFMTLARPQYGHEWREVKRQGIDILFAIDASKSMLAEDIKPNRLERVKMGVMDFVNKLEGDRVGLLPFSGNSFLLCPFTLDYQVFEQSLNAINTEIIPKKGTDLASAIHEAANIFEEAGNNHRVLVIVTDGEDLQGEALQAARDAVEKDVIIYSLGVGSIEGELIPISDPRYGTSYLKDSSGKLVRTKLDEKGLKKIADITGGIYAPFGKRGEGLERIYQKKLGLVPKEELNERMQKVAIERYQWPLVGAIVLLVLTTVMGDRRRPSKKKSTGKKHESLALLLLIFMVSASQSFAETGQKVYNEGVKKYQSDSVSEAKELFQKSIESSDDLSLQARAYYNMGNALFKQGAILLPEGDVDKVTQLWEESIAAYEGALVLYISDKDAEQNLQYVQQKIDELKKQKDEEEEQQQDKGKQDQEGDNSEDNTGEEDTSQEDTGEENSGEENSGEENSREEGSGEEGPDKENSQDAPNQENASKKDLAEDQEEEDGGKDGQKKDEQDQEKEEQANTSNESKDTEEHSGASESSSDAERREAGKMTKEEALQLLKSLEGDEERILIVPYDKTNPHDPDNTTKGKDW